MNQLGSQRPASRGRLHAARLAVLPCVLLASSCITNALWDGDFDRASSDDPDPGGPFHAEEVEPPSFWGTFWYRLALTPFALALDCVTLPIQEFFEVDDDDDGFTRGC